MQKNRLKELRKRHRYTLDDIEEKTGIKRGTYSNYENGNTEPKLETWQKLAKFFNVSVPYLQGETYSQKDIIRILSYEYTSYALNGYSWIKKETTVGIILESYNLMDNLTNTVNDYLIYHNAKLPLQCFTSDELKKCTHDVEKFWIQNFGFVFNDPTIKAIMKYGDTSVLEILKTLLKVIHSRYLKETATIISENFDRVVDDDLKQFISNKDELLRFATKEKIKDKVNNLISQLKNFESTIDNLPANKPKPTRIDSTINYNSKNK